MYSKLVFLHNLGGEFNSYWMLNYFSIMPDLAKICKVVKRIKKKKKTAFRLSKKVNLSNILFVEYINLISKRK